MRALVLFSFVVVVGGCSSGATPTVSHDSSNRSEPSDAGTQATTHEANHADMRAESDAAPQGDAQSPPEHAQADASAGSDADASPSTATQPSAAAAPAVDSHPKPQSDAGSAPPPIIDNPVSDASMPNTSMPSTTASSEGPIDKVDLLFVVDNTNSMLQEQASLKAALPDFMKALTTGVRSNGESTGFRPLHDLHVGVVSSDMGTSGVTIGSCSPDGGDDGRLQHAPHGDGCAASYPSFLTYRSDNDADPAQLANDFACIAALGTGGCGFEQTLEAPFKALWPSVYKDASGRTVSPNPIQFLSITPGGQLGRGDVPAAQGGNLGFLRDDRGTGRSLIAIVVITDEDDCSVRSTELFKAPKDLAPDSPYKMEDINLRCHDNPQLLFDLKTRYLTGLRLLREGDPQRVVFAAITGVPADLVDVKARSGVDFGDDSARDAFYDHVLADPRMQETVDPSSNPGTGTGNVTPACKRTDASGADSTAAPARRIVSLAQLFGKQGIVESICQDDFGPATDAIVELIGKQVSAAQH
jgi:hypothetical protein